MSNIQSTDLLATAEARLAKARVTFEIDDFDRRLLAQHKGGAVFVCNHLLPGLDEWILMAVLSKQFEQVQLLHPYPAPPSKKLRQIALRAQSRQFGDGLWRINFAKRLTTAVEQGAAVGLVLDFSDNLLGHAGKNLMRVQILQQLRRSALPVVPIHLCLERSRDPFSNLLRRTVPAWPLLPSIGPTRVSVRVGTPIMSDDIRQFKRTRLWSRFLRARIFSLGSPFEFKPEQFTEQPLPGQQPLAPPVDPAIISSEIQALPAETKLSSRGAFDILVAPSNALPNTMFEIARLRELTFRAAGEGTGLARDLDDYDLYYLQLIIWDRENQRIVGGYRLGQGDRIFKRFGINGFYTNSLFKFQSPFYPILEQAVELGRSYVVPEYQKHRLPLFLLWKGLLYYMLANPHYRYLYGPVSISKYYTEASKAVIVEFVRKHFFESQLAQWVEPRKPFRVKNHRVNARLLAENLTGEFDALEKFVETAEPAHFRVPVLFRQYLKLNARFIAFNVDPNFSDCLDGLMILDFNNVPASTLAALEK